ncbi:MAG TPA: glycosyltransferase, partial [Chroococcales cyanobacterium]
LLRNRRQKSRKERVSIVYATSRIVDNQYKLFSEGLRKILDQYEDKVELTIWGCQPGELAGHRGVQIINLVPNYERFLEEFSALGFDIGLAPLEDTLFHRSKTNTKYRDYGACKVAGVYSDVDVYSSCVTDGKTGVLVGNTAEEWYRGVASLIDDPALRDNIIASAYADVEKHYSQQNVETEWLNEIEELLKTSMAYSLSSLSETCRTEVLVRADQEGLSGIRFPARSPGDNLPVGKVFLEVMTGERTVLREASTTKYAKEPGGGEADDDITFSFARIQNSKGRDFIFRFIRIPEEGSSPETTYWLPNSGYIHMIYSQAVNSTGVLEYRC